jgi:DNA-binding transcriptional MerR regulator
MSSSGRYLSLKEASALAEVSEDTILFWKKESLLKFIEDSSGLLFCKRLLLRRLKQKESLPLPGASRPVRKVEKRKVQKKKVSSPSVKKVERKKVESVLPLKKEKNRRDSIPKVEKKAEQITLFDVPSPSKKKKEEIKVVESKKSSRTEYSLQPLFKDEGFCKGLSTLTPLAKDLEWKRKRGWLWSTCGRFVICPEGGKGEDATADLWSQSGNKRGTLLSSWDHLRNAKIWAKRLSVQRQWR